MKKPRAPKLVTIAITTTITVIFWIFFTLYQVLTTKPAPSVEPALLEPINPTVDTNTLHKINDRSFYEEGSFTPYQNLKSPQPETVVETPPEITQEVTSTPPASGESQINQ